MWSGARGVRWSCVAALTLSCGQSAESGPSGTAGVAGRPAAGGGEAGGASGDGGTLAGAAGATGGDATGGDATGGVAGAGAPAMPAGSAGKGPGGSTAGAGAAGAAMSGASGVGDAGAPAGMGGIAGSGVGGGGVAFPPFTSFVPRDAAPTMLDGIVGASDVAWKPETDTFFLLTDRSTTFHEYSADFGTVVRLITLVNQPADTEGLAYLGEVGGRDRFALGVEADEDEVLIFELDPEATTLDFATAVIQTYVPGEEPSVANKGWEGVAYRAATNGEPARLWACQEGEPGQVPIRVVGFPYLSDGAQTLSYADNSLAVDEPWNAAEKLDADDLSSIVYDADSDTLLVLSDLSSRLMRVDPTTGDVLDALTLTRSPQYEGVTLASGGRLVLVSEPNYVEVFQLVPPP